MSAPDLPKIDGVVIGGVEVCGPVPFNLIAVWSYLSGSPRQNPVIEALDAWRDWTESAPLVVAGDFNTGGHWQELQTGPKSHFPIVERLEAQGLRSAYHTYRRTDQGLSEEPTLWHSSGGSFMVDHIFTPAPWPVVSVWVGGEDPWRQRSDHAPIVAEVQPIARDVA